MKRTTTLSGLICVVTLLLSACGSPRTASGPGGRVPSSEVSWVDENVSFAAGGITIYGTFRHPVEQTASFPAVLLIAGSGPTDRNGNTPLLPGPVETLQELADWLSEDGVASLRYDKLGSGTTGVGPYGADPAAIGIAPFEQEATGALILLTYEPGVDASRLGIIGHSEGALYALLLATSNSGPAPTVRALGLLEPLSERYLDAITEQVDGQVAAAEQASKLTPAQGSSLSAKLATAVATLRAHGTVPTGLPPSLSSVLNPTTARYLAQADQFDPGALAAKLPVGFPVLVSCSNDDIQVSCAQVDHLVAGLASARAATDFVHLRGVDHVLKQDSSRTAVGYSEPLPFSPQLEAALRTFVESSLR